MNKQQIKPTQYEPFDGDYVDEDYTGLLDDIQAAAGAPFGAYREIAVSLDGDQIRVEFSNNEGNGWEHDIFYPIPPGWTLERLQPMFAGYSVYLETDEFEQTEEETNQ